MQIHEIFRTKWIQSFPTSRIREQLWKLEFLLTIHTEEERIDIDIFELSKIVSDFIDFLARQQVFV